MDMRIPSRAGLAILFAVSVCGVLAVLGMAFVAMAQMERQSSRRRMDASRALCLARSGMEEGLARFAAGQDPDAPGTRYGGENWDGSADGLLSTYEATQEVYRPAGVGSRADLESCPPSHAMRPSFFARIGPTSNPATRRVDGRDRGWTGSMDGDWSLRMTGGGFHVNGGDPAVISDPSATSDQNTSLRRMLGVLAEALDREDGLDDGLPVDQADGEALVAARPPAGWRSLLEIRDLALAGSPAKLNALAPYLALHAWVDRKVIEPNARAAYVGSAPPSWDRLKLEGYAGVKPDFVKIAGRVVGRAPVSLSWARTRRPALIALLGGLKGMYVNECEADPGRIGRVDSVEIVLDWSLGTDECRDVADRILASTSELGTWAQWNAFCETLPLAGGQDDAAAAKRDLLKANFNPNSDLNKFNPGPTMWRAVDKMDLLVHSTEWSLGGAGGIRLACTGRVCRPDGSLLAQRTLEAEVAGPARIRLTTQREFAAGDLGDLETAGDETALRVPGASTPYISVSRSGDLVRTWGHRLSGLESMGASLQTYPEPCVDAGSGLSQNVADYDGHLQLATVETADTDLWGVDGALGGLRMLGRFTTGLDLDFPVAVTNVEDAAQVTRAELSNGLLDSVKTNTLYPDGNYSESGKVSSYADAAYIDGFHGVLSFWMRNNYARIGAVTGGTGNRRGHRFIKWTNRAIAAGVGHISRKQFFAVVDFSAAPGPTPQTFAAGEPNSRMRQIVAFFEQGHHSGDASEHMFPTAFKTFRRGEWNLVTVAYDLHGFLRDERGETIRDAGVLPGELGQADVYGDAPALLDPTYVSSLTLELPGGNEHRLILGNHGGFGDFCTPGIGGGADTTFDELAVYDFGGGEVAGAVCTPATPEELAAPSILALNRFRTGRYYKGAVHVPVSPSPSVVRNEAPSWVSAPVSLPVGTWLRRVDWTWMGPEALPDDCAVMELVDPAGTQYLWAPAQSRSALTNQWAVPPASWTVNRAPGGAFRIRAVFWRKRASPTVDENIPILDSPALDDITLEYDLPEGRRLLAWGAGD